MRYKQLAARAPFRVGVAKEDITGPIGPVMMGMGFRSQEANGLLNRLFARTFVIENPENGNTLAIVVADIWACTAALKREVVRGLSTLRTSDHRPVFTEENVLLCGTHTHSQAGAFSDYSFYNTWANTDFNQLLFNRMVGGIVRSVGNAYGSMADGDIKYSLGTIENCGKNRSKAAFDRNPQEDRAPGEIDNTMKLLQFLRVNGGEERGVGAIAWYPLHPTNFGTKNRFITGDNKGMASQNVESQLSTPEAPFVAAFPNSNCGDVSGNVIFRGTGIDERAFSQNYLASGQVNHRWKAPNGRDDFMMAQHNARLLSDKALELIRSGGDSLASNDVGFALNYVNMASVHDERGARLTWPSAVGAAMLRGSSYDSDHVSLDACCPPSDCCGPGLGVMARCCTLTCIEEGLNRERLTHLIRTQRGCLEVAIVSVASCIANRFRTSHRPVGFEEGQGEKPIVVATGVERVPQTPQILPLQLVRLGQICIAAVPGEPTTVAGRRIRRSVEQYFGEGNVIETSHSGAYGGYFETREGYAAQHYEGASTLFGPGTVAALQLGYQKLARVLDPNQPDSRQGLFTSLQDYCDNSQEHLSDPMERGRDHFGRRSRVIPTRPEASQVDSASLRAGAVKVQPAAFYTIGNAVVAEFWSGHPNTVFYTNGEKPEESSDPFSTYLLVEKYKRANMTAFGADRDTDHSNWERLCTDDDSRTRIQWKKQGCAHVATVRWDTTDVQEPGIYRLRHNGKVYRGGVVSEYSGVSRSFNVNVESR